jgi:pyridinium-3,5-bisthiocarboxylic acid mononucleotide nickel chelatase
MLVRKTHEYGEQRNSAFSEVAGSSGNGREVIVVLEVQLDDITGEALGYAMDKLFTSGALDVFYTPVYMKKNRPGTLLTVLTLPESADRCERTLLMETTTLGVRRATWTRRKLKRRVVSVETPYGPVRLKQAIFGENLIRHLPEYEDVAEAARRAGVPFYQVYQTTMNSCLAKGE